ncbi:hypothetical protein F3Y22_tig00016066pilonHSYRG00008 [Hibiscus syriacus]|uniref:RNase H type-1 domain-containing protein n=1 Tax=Hibiscus syriacus TaxID=106335 RepID=A0A6A3BZK4_HIBSY|nr:hypothetical protein F3Y22_tig00016066pilonHSYRG00008 [Hibiscus syriacus]
MASTGNWKDCWRLGVNLEFKFWPGSGLRRKPPSRYRSFPRPGKNGVDNSDGWWLLSFAKFIGICSILEAELWGVYQGLCCDKDGGFNQETVEVDCSAVLKEISNSNLVSSHLLVVHHISKLLEGEWIVHFNQVPRQNGTDCSAKKVDRRHDDCVVFSDPPLNVQTLLHEDLAAIVLP